MTDRYQPHYNLKQIGKAGQQKLSNASVLVLGAGGLGCPVITYLAGLGIGRIGIVDHDVVETRNLNRQFLYKEADQGKPKVEIAVKYIRELNSEIKVGSFYTRFSITNGMDLVRDFDIIIDCLDNFDTRFILDEVCEKMQKPFVYGAVGGFEGQVSVFNYKNGVRYTHLFPDREAFNCINTCDEVGITAYTCSFAASLQVNEAVKVLLDLGNVAEGELITFDLMEPALRKFKFF